MDKNKIVRVDIVDNGVNFEGIAKLENKVMFIPNTVIGETVDAKVIKLNKNYCIGRLEEIVNKSEHRCEPMCEVAHKCGGCSAQHIDYDMQLLLKQNMVRNVLDKQKIEYKVLENTVGMGRPYYYRNKVQYPVRCDRNGNTKLGFYSKRSHNIVENDTCYIQNLVIDILAKDIFDILTKLKFSGYNEDDGSGDIRHILIRMGYYTGEIMVVIVANNDITSRKDDINIVVKEITKIDDSIKGIFVNINSSNTNEILGEETIKIYGEDYITDYIGVYKYVISPKSFFQVNTVQTEILYNTLKDGLNLKGDETLFDLYSGVGAIGIFLSDSVKYVYGIEIEKSAVDMANINIVNNEVKNAEYIVGSVSDRIVEFKNRNIKPNVIVVDPPRRGLDENSIKYILDFKSEKIGYVSCNPATLARDLKSFEKDYIVNRITPVDMFPYTSAIECVAILERK